MVQATLDTFGKLDILVNNAGWDIVEPFTKNTPEFWEKIIAITSRAPSFAPGQSWTP